MANRLPRIAFDVDGVFADFTTGFMTLINEKFGTNFVWQQWKDYWDPIVGSTSKHPLFTQEQWDYAWQQLAVTPFFWAHLPAIEGVNFDQIELEMATFQYNGYFVTRRRDLDTVELGDSNALTRIFFENHGINNASAIISSLTKNRISVLKEISADAYLDDWADQMLEAREAGLNAYLIDRPHNQWLDTPYRVFSIHEYVNKALGRERTPRLFVMPAVMPIAEAATV